MLGSEPSATTLVEKMLKNFVIEPPRGVTTLTNAVSGQSQNCSGNLEISPGIGTLGNFSGKHAIIPGHCRKKSGHPVMYPQNSGG